MAFLRMSKRRAQARKSEERRMSMSQERDAWLAQRQAEARNPQAKMLGRTFATKRKAAEYAYRLVNDEFLCSNMGASVRSQRLMEGSTPKERNARSGRLGPAKDARPIDGAEFDRNVKGKARRFTPAKAGGHSVRVRPVHGIWRRYVEAADQAWRWVSDHASMDDALQAVRPLNNPE